MRGRFCAIQPFLVQGLTGEDLTAQKGSILRGISDACLAVIGEDFDDAALPDWAMSAACHHSLKLRATGSGQAANLPLARLLSRPFGRRRVGLLSLAPPS